VVTLVHQDVVIGGISLLDVVELPLLVHVDQDPIDRVAQAGALDLSRLEHHVAVQPRS
jgi:hypothetical protein